MEDDRSVGIVRAIVERRLARILKRFDDLDKDIDAFVASLGRDRVAFEAWLARSARPRSPPVPGRVPGRPRGSKDRTPRRPRRDGTMARLFHGDDGDDLGLDPLRDLGFRLDDR